MYDRVEGKILKTVDSVYQAIDSKEDCEDLCNNAPYKCHSYDFNDTGDNVCRYGNKKYTFPKWKKKIICFVSS